MEVNPLQELHKRVAEELLKRINEGKASAQDLGVAARFLKDNGIQSVPQANPAMMDLAKKLPFDPEEEFAFTR